MELRVHFVVYYDSETKELVRDDETAMAHFDDALVFVVDSEDWVNDDAAPAPSREAGAAIDTALELYNSVIKKIGGSP
jgi:hypothetical protein